MADDTYRDFTPQEQALASEILDQAEPLLDSLHEISDQLFDWRTAARLAGMEVTQRHLDEAASALYDVVMGFENGFQDVLDRDRVSESEMARRAERRAREGHEAGVGADPLKPKRKRNGKPTKPGKTGYMMVSPEWFEGRLLGGVSGPNREAIEHYFAFLRAVLASLSRGGAHELPNDYERARADALGLECLGDRWCGDVVPDHNGAPSRTAPNWAAAPSLTALQGIVGPPSAAESGLGSPLPSLRQEGGAQ